MLVFTHVHSGGVSHCRFLYAFGWKMFGFLMNRMKRRPLKGYEVMLITI